MNILIAHLSDIHITSASDPIINRVDKIADAIRSVDPGAVFCFVVVTGDVVFSGDSEEYEIALKFFLKLGQSIELGKHSLVLNYIFVPGNHDCNFHKASEVRQILIENISSRIEKLSRDNSILKTCLAPQEEYFKFLSMIYGEAYINDSIQQLYHEREFSVENKLIRFNCYNTAWLSQLNEVQGALYFPVNTIRPKEDRCDLILSAFHHPYNWLEADNARLFRRHMERTSDIVLTGHEHDSHYYQKLTISGEVSHYTEGAVLQDAGTDASGFNVILVDLEEKKHKVTQYFWKTDIYVPHQETSWTQFQRGRNLSSGFEPKQEFMSHLSDLGVALSHPLTSGLGLKDVFVYPDIEVGEYAKNLTGGDYVYGENLVEHVLTHPRCLFFGQDLSGKTCLAKMLYSDLLKLDLVPLLIDGANLKNSQEDSFLKTVQRAFENQYDRSWEQYKQLPHKRKILIIDDLDDSKLNKKAQGHLLDIAVKHFGVVLAFVDEFFMFESLTHPKQLETLLMDFHHCYMLEFGHRLRGKLIEKWFSLGHDYPGEEATISHKIASAEKLINTLIGKRVLPSHPLNLLVILQAIEFNVSINTASGALGQYYEVLLTRALTGVLPLASLDTKYTYLSCVAFAMFNSGQEVLSVEELRDLAEDYYTQYKVRINSEAILKDLERALIFQPFSDGYAFKYKYFYHYFTAHYLAENYKDKLNDESLKRTIQHLIDKSYINDYAQITVFYIYLTKDSEVIHRLLRNARQLYDKCEPCDMQKHVSFLNELRSGKVKMRLDSLDIKLNREKYREQLDNIDDEDQADGNQFEDLLQMGQAIRTIEMSGQILRSFPGSLKGELKLEIARETYLLGLRLLNSFLQVVESNLSAWRLFFSSVLLRDDSGGGSEPTRKTDRALFLFIVQFASGVLSLVSRAVGSEQLKETFRQVLVDDSSIPMLMIDTAIKFEHFGNIPETEILRLYSGLRENQFSSTLVRLLALNYLYLYPTSYQTRQRLCTKLDISVNASKFLEVKSKMIN